MDSIDPLRPDPHLIALVDDHSIVSVAFEALLAVRPDLEYVGSTETVEEVLDRFPRLDLVVLDIRLSDGSSPVNNVARLSSAGVKTLAFTSGEDPYLVRLTAKTEVLGIVRKSEPPEVILDAVSAAANNQPVVSAEWASAVDADPEFDRANLSPQEQRVLAMFADGAKAQAVAYANQISPATVEDYVRRIRAKYVRAGRPAPTKVDLYKRAVEDGFLPSPSSPGTA
ncbi:LuxR C-terminal-related transcriptional regulator [Microbacterium sp. E-13]|uniref:LuxR C-terminal-related transcriptional regulator n=1 Tax=Microbacterium sp. E-13 TaxID=3404048 RepID=UPI003CF2BD71